MDPQAVTELALTFSSSTFVFFINDMTKIPSKKNLPPSCEIVLGILVSTIKICIIIILSHMLINSTQWHWITATYRPQNEICSLFIAVPLRQVEFHSEALSQVIQDVLLCQTASIHHSSHHLSNTVRIKGVIFPSFHQLFKNLVVCEINQCLRDRSLLDHKNEAHNIICLQYTAKELRQFSALEMTFHNENCKMLWVWDP